VTEPAVLAAGGAFSEAKGTFSRADKVQRGEEEEAKEGGRGVWITYKAERREEER